MNGAVAFTPKTTCANARAEIERRIGELVADAAGVVCAGLGDWESGIAPATQTQAGELFVTSTRSTEPSPPNEPSNGVAAEAEPGPPERTIEPAADGEYEELRRERNELRRERDEAVRATACLSLIA
jgi:hypothetical protein